MQEEAEDLSDSGDHDGDRNDEDGDEKHDTWDS